MVRLTVVAGWHARIRRRSCRMSVDTSPRPRLLMVSRNPPTGVGTGSRIRAGFFLDTLLQRYDVHLLVISPEADSADLQSPLLARCASLTTDDMAWQSRERWREPGGDSGALDFLWHALRAPATNVPVLQHTEGEALVARLPYRDYDAVVAIRLSMASVAQQLLDWGLLRARRRVFDLDDIESRLLARERALDGRRTGFAVGVAKWIRQQRLERTEQRLTRTWDQVYVCSTADRDLMHARSRNSTVHCVPNTCPPTTAAPAGAATAGEILFVGSLRYPPNDDAVQFFCEQVWPHLCERLPFAPTLRIVGAGPSIRVKAFAHDPRIDVMGAVKSLDERYRAAALVIAPIRFGGGTRIKIIEALAAGRPVVATSVGAEGLGLRDGAEILLADAPEAFAAACAKVLTDAGVWQTLAQQGRAVYEARFAREIVAEDLLRTLSPLLDDAMS